MRNLIRYLMLLLVVTALLPGQYGPARADRVDDMVQDLNSRLQSEGLPWQAGRNRILELNPEERKNLLGGPNEPLPPVNPTDDISGEMGTAPEEYTGGAPISWDWRNKDGINWMTPVTEQHCGDCWAHATMGSMEVRLRWLRGGTYGYELPINLSERFAVSCSPHGSCSDWNIPGVLSFVQSTGVPDEECLPYNAALTCTDRCSNWSYRVYKVDSYGTHYSGSSYIDNVMNSCYLNGPVPVWMMVYSDIWGYSGGIYVKSASAVEEGGHFVNIIGWGTSGGVPYWICKNSWGADWGVNGYFYIRRGTNESRIEEQAYWLTPQVLSNLDDSTPTGWDYPIVPRGDNSATSTNCRVPATLPGNSDSTYWNVNWTNEGTVMARDNVTHLSVDGIYERWFSLNFQPAGYESRIINTGTHIIRGGRHTICLDEIDWDNRVWEYDERDNWYCRQFIWSPLTLINNTPVTRNAAPPILNSLGYSYYNCDGFQFNVQSAHPNDWWSAVGILPSSTSADYDIRLHDIGTYTGSQGGFETYLESSSYSGSVSDFVIINDNMATAGNYYAGAINFNNGSGAFRIEEDTSEKIYLRPGTEWNGPYIRNDTNVLDIYEVYLTAGTYYFLLDQTSGTSDLGMSLYDPGTVTARKIDYVSGGYANSGGDGADEAFQVSLVNTGYYGLVVWKADASDYAKNHAYRLAAGPPGITVLTANGGETLYLNSYYNITWDSFGSAIGSSVMIEISLNAGSTWSTITSSTSNDGTYTWTVTGPVSSQCRFRVTSTTNSSYTDTSNANFTIADNAAPTPNPMTWATEPYQLDISQIRMTASTASDPTTPITYFFDYVSSPTGGAGGTDSVWTTSSTYTDAGLSTNHQYGYRVAARDGGLNTTGYSAISYEYTAIEQPAGITFGTITNNSIAASSSNTPSGLTRGGSGLYVNNTTAGTASGWKQDNNYWMSSGLNPNTSYTFRAIARNGDQDQTGWSPSSSLYTLANAPSAAPFGTKTTTSITAVWGANGNPTGTQYLCENTTTGANSGWITGTSWNSTGLVCGSTYGFRVLARNGNGTPTAYTSLGSTSALPCADICECDLNADKSCNILDYQNFIQDWGRTNCGTPPGSGNPPNDCECDLNNDGSCNILDYQVFIQDWGRTNCP